MEKALLDIRDLHVSYNHYEILSGINMQIYKGERICILGKNGVGKSTLLKSIGGLIDIKDGKILLEGIKIEKMSIQTRTNLGIGFLMQNEAIFPRLTIEDHILLASENKAQSSKVVIWDKIQSVFPQLVDDRKKIAGQLSGGQKRFLSFAMLIAQEANKLWLLDEPSAGVSQGLLNKLALFLEEYIPKNNITMLLVEQNIEFGKAISSNQIVLENKSKLITF